MVVGLGAVSCTDGEFVHATAAKCPMVKYSLFAMGKKASMDDLVGRNARNSGNSEMYM